MYPYQIRNITEQFGSCLFFLSIAVEINRNYLICSIHFVWNEYKLKDSFWNKLFLTLPTETDLLYKIWTSETQIRLHFCSVTVAVPVSSFMLLCPSLQLFSCCFSCTFSMCEVKNARWICPMTIANAAVDILYALTVIPPCTARQIVHTYT